MGNIPIQGQSQGKFFAFLESTEEQLRLLLDRAPRLASDFHAAVQRRAVLNARVTQRFGPESK
jgi:hypothetical protein